MATLPPALPLEEQRELGISLIEPSLPMLRDPVPNIEHREFLRAVARLDPAKALELANGLAEGFFPSQAREAAARSLIWTDFDEGLAVMAGLDPPWNAVQACVFACDELIDRPREQRVKLLDVALPHALTEPDPGYRARELGRIAVRWLDLGERERGVELLRVGQALAESLPAPTEANLGQTGQAGLFAGLLARIDGPAALKLIEGFSERPLNNFRTEVARGLADHDPAEAERLWRSIESPQVYYWMRLAPLQRMAVADAQRAARLARTFVDPCERSFALGTVAHGLAAKDRAAAAQLLEEAYDVLDDARPLGPAQFPRDPALTAAALLPVVEKFDPALVEGYFWRALSLREPWPAAGESARIYDMLLTDLATMIARYDREIARDLLAPLVGRLRQPSSCMMGLAVADPHWAAELVQALGDSSAPLAKNPQQIAARALAAWLALPPRGYWGLWESVYRRCYLRDLDTMDDLW